MEAGVGGVRTALGGERHEGGYDRDWLCCLSEESAQVVADGISGLGGAV